MRTEDDADMNRRIQSVEVGFSILRAVADHKRSMTLSELYTTTGLHKSQLYRYLNSFVRLGVLIRYDDEIPKWLLGPELIALGGAAFDEIDIAKQAGAKMIDLRNRINETVALSIWRERGPFFLRWEKSNKTVNVGVDTGSYVPLYTATGKVFRAFLPEEVTDPFYLDLVDKGTISPEAYNLEVDSVRKTGLSMTESSINSATTALSTPIFNALGQLAGALSIIGLRGVLNTAPDGQAVAALKETAEEISYRMGYRLR
ncbi:IclR family transcriptional regulator [Alicyclobacillus sp. ALC3]|uniref:IclR family transcriptional regulator n=1 Tax=Alicyclobacillus sp. ALC3 TaxID=2796143 RepID=UPI002379B5BC|nr:IclR family transcriptional regulator [Alicyclobacillus sp. ALC3]WDL97635.1 IclR family transcriptional regulator [Alicyclobacillus sp. ALC3]